MVLVQRIAQPRADHMSVDFSSSEIGMAEHCLNAAQIGASFE